MSRAFVKETADGAPPPERMVADGPNPVTETGLAQITAHVTRLEAALKTESNVLLRETLERDLRYWAVRQGSAVVVPRSSGDTVAFGSTVTFMRGGRKQTYRIVGEDEASPAHGLLNVSSPLAAALIGAREGEVVDMTSPPGEIEILKIES